MHGGMFWNDPKCYYVIDEYDKKYKFKIHSNRVNTGNKHFIITNY